MSDDNVNKYHDTNEQDNLSPIKFHTFHTEKFSHSNFNKKQKIINYEVILLFITMIFLILLVLSSFLILFFKFSKETGKNLKQNKKFKGRSLFLRPNN